MVPQLALPPHRVSSLILNCWGGRGGDWKAFSFSFKNWKDAVKAEKNKMMKEESLTGRFPFRQDGKSAE